MAKDDFDDPLGDGARDPDLDYFLETSSADEAPRLKAGSKRPRGGRRHRKGFPWWAVVVPVVLIAGVLVALKHRGAEGGLSGAGPDVPQRRSVAHDGPLRIATDDTPITSLAGAIFPQPDSLPVLVGYADEGLPPISARRAYEYFAVALRSYFLSGKAPAVSIDPTPEQVREAHGRGGRMTGDMVVRYEGRSARTSLGLVMFAADRRMKCLQFGKDNITQDPVTIDVPGFRTEFERSLADDTEQPSGEAWHRFWFVPEASEVQVTSSGNAFRMDSMMRVETRHMTPTATGELVDSGVQASATAEAFAQHFTDSFEQYARADPVYRELEVASQMTALAKVVFQRAIDSDLDNDIPIDLSYWLVSHPVQAVATPMTTPALYEEQTRESEQDLSGGVVRTTTRVVTLVGGVDLDPQNWSVIESEEAAPPESYDGSPPPRRGALRRHEGPSVTLSDLEFMLELLPFGGDRQVLLSRAVGASPLPQLLVADEKVFEMDDGGKLRAPFGFVVVPEMDLPLYELVAIAGGGGGRYHAYKSPDGRYEVARVPEGYRLAGNQTETIFSPEGLPLSSRDASGPTYTCEWNGKELAQYTAGGGAPVRFAYGPDGFLTEWESNGEAVANPDILRAMAVASDADLPGVIRSPQLVVLRETMPPSERSDWLAFNRPLSLLAPELWLTGGMETVRGVSATTDLVIVAGRGSLGAEGDAATAWLTAAHEAGALSGRAALVLTSDPGEAEPVLQRLTTGTRAAASATAALCGVGTGGPDLVGAIDAVLSEALDAGEALPVGELLQRAIERCRGRGVALPSQIDQSIVTELG